MTYDEALKVVLVASVVVALAYWYLKSLYMTIFKHGIVNVFSNPYEFTDGIPFVVVSMAIGWFGLAGVLVWVTNL